ncbi:glutamate decarboxylase [soil metagenome]
MKNLASDIIHRSLKNLGTFSTSYMEEDAREIFDAYAPLNGIDSQAYPELEIFYHACEEFLLSLSQTDNQDDFRIISTHASSEAILLGLYFLKQHWKRTSALNDKKPHIIISKHTHFSWQKAAEYLGIQIKVLPTRQDTLNVDTEKLTLLLDKNTLAVCATLGSPTTLCFDDIAKINTILQAFQEENHLFVPIHVDAASGGFVAPFIYPQLDWGFKLPHVYSINISSHKYGLIYPSLGWLLMRKTICPDAYAFQHDYLGKTLHTFAMRFSHSAAHLAVQYHYSQTKGYPGYQAIIKQLFSLTKKLKLYLLAFDEIIILSSETTPQLPGVVFSVKPTIYLQRLVANLRQQGWILPIYTLPFQTHTLSVARIVLRYGMTEATIETLLVDLKNAFYHLRTLP